MNKTLHTKFGTAKIGNRGYYRITSGKEGNNMKLLHILIWQDFYGCEVPEGYDVHHINGNKTDNCILNLQLMRASEHRSLHKKGVKFTHEHKKKLSDAKRGEKNHMYGKRGINSPICKYTLWSVEHVLYSKGAMFNNGREPNPCKCFKPKCKGKRVPIGYFVDFISAQMISDLIMEALEE